MERYLSQAAIAVMMELLPHCCLDAQVFLAVMWKLAVVHPVPAAEMSMGPERSKRARLGCWLLPKRMKSLPV